MGDRRRGAVLAGAGAALAGSGSLLTRHGAGLGDFWTGATMGAAIGLLILALLCFRRASRCAAGIDRAFGSSATW